MSTETEPHVGDLVIVPYPAARERIGCGAEVGLALEDRRHVLKVYFPSSARVFWLERAQLQSIPLGRLQTDPHVAQLHQTAQAADAEQIEFYDGDDRKGLVYVFSRGMSADHFTKIREIWGDELVGLRVVPANMRTLRLELTIRDAQF